MAGCGCIDCTDITIPTGSQGATGPAGPAGANGTNGTNGVAVLHNDITDSSTIGIVSEILKTYTLPLNTLDSNDSFIKINARFRTNTSNDPFISTKEANIYFNGSLLTTYEFLFKNVPVVEFEVIIDRFSNTVGKSKVSWNEYTQGNYLKEATTSAFGSIGGLNFTTTAYDVTARANSDVIGDITCEFLTVTKYKK